MEKFEELPFCSSTHVLGHEPLTLTWLFSQELDAVLRCDRGLFCADVSMPTRVTGCSAPRLPRVGSLRGPPAPFVLLSSPSHRWTWTWLVLEAEAETVIDFSPLSVSASGSQATAEFLLQETDE